ncbi:MAG TPA: HEAT repeat domain-containing protein [Candidatus Hydrogenedentes bacterium]|nr:HEAT repeat domain-containing protein [Candidatus Hydrogenedentota bacterium]
MAVLLILSIIEILFAEVPPSPEKTEALLKRMENSEDPVLRMRAIEGWSSINSSEAPDHLLKAITDPEAEIREVAAHALRRTGEKPVPTPLEEKLANRVLEIINGGDESATTALSSILPEFRRMIGARMCSIAGSEKEPMPRRCAAAYCLGQMRLNDAEPVLVKGTASEDAEFVRVCADSLHRLGNESCLPVWGELVLHDDPEVRGIAVEALADLGGARALDILARLVLQGIPADQELQQQAFQSLSRWSNPEIVPILVACLDNNPVLGPKAMQALRERTGLDLGNTPKAWKDWYAEQTGQAQARKEREKIESAPPYVPPPLHWLDSNPEDQFKR